MVPLLLLLSFAGAIANEEFVRFDGKGVFLRRGGISPRNSGNEKLFHTQRFSYLVSCLAVTVCHASYV